MRTLRLSFLVVVGALLVASLVGVSSPASAGPSACGSGSTGGYSYAGHQATYKGHGVRATITPLRTPQVAGGHVAGWVGVGGPGQGPKGDDLWMQVGIASVQGVAPFSYVEITRGGKHPEFVLIEEGLATGRAHRFAVLEVGGRPGWWRAWVDGRPMTEPVHLSGSSGRWAPIATAESLSEGQCNAFSFRFERVSVSYGGGGSWRPFVPGHRFLDGGNKLRPLASAAPKNGQYARTLSGGSPQPFAFLATSGS